jgi:lysozyme
MQTSANGRKFIEGFEGLFLHAYNDGTGVWTIGYGHTTAAGPPRVYPGQVITAQQADDILSADLHSVENEVNRVVTVPLNQNQYDSLVSFDFNTGALARSSLLRDINNKHFDRIRDDFMMWVHAGGRVLNGLVRRRSAEADMFFAGAPALTGKLRRRQSARAKSVPRKARSRRRTMGGLRYGDRGWLYSTAG